MNNYEEIKELLKKKKLKQILLIALSNSLKLKLNTSAKTKDKLSNIETKINLIRGITTKTNNLSLLSQEDQVFQFHQQQVEKAYETWDKNRETLVQILQIIGGNSLDLSTFSKELSSLSKEENSSEEETNYIENEAEDNLEDDFADFEFDTPSDENKQEIEADISENWIDDIDNEIENPVEENLNSVEIIDISTDIVEEENIFSDEEKEENEEEENWDDFMDEMPMEDEISPQEVVINSDTQAVSPSLEVEEDWQEWLQEDNLPHQNGEYDSEAIDWNQEDWQEEEEIPL
ncbi:MAG: hypothetical protein GW795_05135 [Cyanobacteria bacterium]|nr:hypothetical protein [Cyanobacteria bacterium CG_2015-16_32_12]NCO79191.1 hypothetical protein [Cyanobacteria bacterium CG_2015-22_32_23]NCQ04933.1 hypothetical protein [Cyanobacteria bacterium CG_2015-09_32_10]NCQ41270.1 hypothetical protein [Cyanobacteria bacterium CG_2015-04_32_10]NCS84090.1 hypothetical protein [Cyanobacteria bacterium CG_2015-02_32_10]